jgi:uncharacterized protein
MDDANRIAEAQKALEEIDCPFADGAALTSAYGEPLPYGLMMHVDHIHPHYAHYIKHSPFCIVTTADADGWPAASPKGDHPGFVRILDKHTLVFPDRPGNDQIQSLHNILVNPRVQLIFMIPGVAETVRVSGMAKISQDPELMEKARYRDKLPESVVVIKVTKAYMHCGKALIRSKLWEEEAKVAKGTIPSIAKITWDIKDGKDIPMPLEEFEAFGPIYYRDTLY